MPWSELVACPEYTLKYEEPLIVIGLYGLALGRGCMTLLRLTAGRAEIAGVADYSEHIDKD